MTMFINVHGEQTEPCSDGCPGYVLAHIDSRKPRKALAYPHNRDCEIQRCDDCARFHTDEGAHAQWLKDGQPKL